MINLPHELLDFPELADGDLESHFGQFSFTGQALLWVIADIWVRHEFITNENFTYNLQISTTFVLFKESHKFSFGCNDSAHLPSSAKQCHREF